MQGGGRFQVVSQLEQVREVIGCGWTQGQMARDANGIPTHPRHPSAVCWCIVGAIQKVTGYDRRSSELEGVLEELRKDLSSCNGVLSTFNDTCKDRLPVIALVNRTIKRLQKEMTA